MRLHETDWDAPGGAAEVDWEYPDQPVAEFVNWLRRTSAWRENHELVERRVRRLNALLMDLRNSGEARRADNVPGTMTAEIGTVTFGTAVAATPDMLRATEIKNKRLAALAKAREAKKVRRAG